MEYSVIGESKRVDPDKADEYEELDKGRRISLNGNLPSKGMKHWA